MSAPNTEVQEAPTLKPVDGMTDRALLEECVTNQRELLQFAHEVSAGMGEFYAKLSSHPILAKLFGMG
jgi:hypothetical protein